jgi:tripartite-type tricarboxylate transporter receptor subunit TctC
MNVIGEAFKKEAGVDMTHIPFKGAAPLKQELLAGRLISAATSCRLRWPRSSRES